MKKNKTKEVTLTFNINRKGNWNRSNNSSPLYTKPITQIFIDGDEFVWKHDEILKLIKAYYLADIQSIQMIKEGKAGEVKHFEKSLLEKIKEFIIQIERR